MKIEKIIITGFSAIAGSIITNKLTTNIENKKSNTILGAIFGGAVGFAIYKYYIANKADTLNYTLQHNGKKVYVGITKQKRLNRRVYEHTIKGKIFDEIIFDDPKPLKKARQLEKISINRLKPKYNIQHKH